MSRSFLFVSLLAAVIAVPTCFGSATKVYITQSGSPAGNCTANVQTPAFFNSSSNWGSGASQIGPGTTVLICGTFTGAAGATEFTFQGSGANGNPVTLQFDSGAVLTAPYWSGSGAISCSNHQYIVVNGGTNGLIENTANGTGLANQQTSGGVEGNSCSNMQVENLTIKGIYMNQGSSSSASDGNGDSTYDIQFNGTSTNNIVNNNTLSSSKTAISFAPDPGDGSNIQIYGNSTSDMDWGIVVGGGDSGTTINNLVIHDNTITNWTNWQFPSSVYHQDGIIIFNDVNPAGLTATLYNNHIYGDLGVGSPTGFIYCGGHTSCTLYNNLLVNTGHVIYGIMWLGASSILGKDMNVYNNTIVDTTGTTGVCIMLNISGQANVENNICTGSHLYPYSSYLSSLTSVMAVSNYNDWNTGSIAFGSQTSGSTSSYSSWLSAGFDAASTTASPNLNVSYHLGAGSAAAGLGTNLTSLGIATLNMDMAGNPRSATASKWDAGVYVANTKAPAPPTNLTGTVQLQ